MIKQRILQKIPRWEKWNVFNDSRKNKARPRAPIISRWLCALAMLGGPAVVRGAIASPLPPATDQRTISLTITANDPSGASLDAILVWDNDVPIFGIRGLPLPPQLSKWSGVIPKPIPLVHGTNKLQIAVRNSAGMVSLMETRYIKCTAASVPNLYVLAVGVSNYSNPKYHLNFAAKDAEDLYAYLTSKPSRFGNTRILGLSPITNSDATVDNIMSKKAILMHSQPDDTVILFFSGHGMLGKGEDKNYYYATYDIDKDHPNIKGLEYGKIMELLDDIPARNRLVFIDTCHSGPVDQSSQVPNSSATSPLPSITLQDSGSRGRVIAKGVDLEAPQSVDVDDAFALMLQLFADLDRGEGAHVIAAASGYDLAYEFQNIKNGTFTHALLEALNNPKLAGADIQHGLTVTQVSSYVERRVNEMTHGIQHVTPRQDNIDNDFSIH